MLHPLVATSSDPGAVDPSSSESAVWRHDSVRPPPVDAAAAAADVTGRATKQLSDSVPHLESTEHKDLVRHPSTARGGIVELATACNSPCCSFAAMKRNSSSEANGKRTYSMSVCEYISLSLYIYIYIYIYIFTCASPP